MWLVPLSCLVWTFDTLNTFDKEASAGSGWPCGLPRPCVKDPFRPPWVSLIPPARSGQLEGPNSRFELSPLGKGTYEAMMLDLSAGTIQVTIPLSAQATLNATIERSTTVLPLEDYLPSSLCIILPPWERRFFHLILCVSCSLRSVSYSLASLSPTRRAFSYLHFH